MDKHIHSLLSASEHYAQSEAIEIAKGKYDLKQSFWKQLKRKMLWQLRKQ
jgi:hypothetical protein